MLLSDGSVIRYKFIQRLGHWINAAAFLLLLATGFFIFFSPLSPLASHFSRTIHRVAAVFLLLGPIMYFLTDRHDFLHLLKASFTYNKNDLIWLAKMPFYFIGLAEGLPPQGEINAGQRVHHAFTILFYNVVAASGIVLWFGKGHLSGDVILGSLMVHDISMAVLTVLMVGHVYFTFVYGALSGMISGRINAAYPRMEHPLWVKELQARQRAGQSASRKTDVHDLSTH